jgi:membrane-associated protease RseP (regulator of RpoE activity)
LAIDGARPASPEEFVSLIQAHRPGDAVRLEIDRNGSAIDVTVGLGSNPNQGASFGKAYLGVSTGYENGWVDKSVWQAAGATVRDVGDMAWRSIKGVGSIINPVNLVGHLTGTNQDLNTRPSTVVGISRASESIGQSEGLAGVLVTLAFVNVFVGLFNLFPLLPFDGGHAAIATYERLRSRRGKPPYRADVSKMMPVAIGVMTLLAFIFLTGFYLDIAKPL